MASRNAHEFAFRKLTLTFLFIVSSKSGRGEAHILFRLGFHSSAKYNQAQIPNLVHDLPMFASGPVIVYSPPQAGILVRELVRPG